MQCQVTLLVQHAQEEMVAATHHSTGAHFSLASDLVAKQSSSIRVVQEQQNAGPTLRRCNHIS